MATLTAQEEKLTVKTPKTSPKPRSQQGFEEITYPDSDGKPMADNTKQFNWIVKIKENLERIFSDNPNVFIAGDLLWYPVEGDNKTRVAPDVLAAFGRPKGDRGSYRTWEEDNIVPQVVFEILSPGNTPVEMRKKFQFYERYGVEEYYLYDPDNITLEGWIRSGDRLRSIENMSGWISPTLRIRFELQKDDLYIFGPDGQKFLSPVELDRKYQAELQLERQKTEAERQRAEKLAAKLRELGIEFE